MQLVGLKYKLIVLKMCIFKLDKRALLAINPVSYLYKIGGFGAIGYILHRKGQIQLKKITHTGDTNSLDRCG